MTITPGYCQYKSLCNYLTVLVDVEGHDERLTIERSMCVNSVGCAATAVSMTRQSLSPVQCAVEHVEIRKVITSLSQMSYTLYIEAILYF